MTADINELFAKRLRSAMDSRGLTIAEVARRAGMYAPNISDVLRGVETCSLSRAHRLAAAVGVALSELIEKNVERD